MIILFTLFLTDFILTYLGISAGAIEEANPLLVWLFELPFIAGLTIRIIMGAIIICYPIYTIRRGKIRPALAKAYYGVAYTANIVILGMHLYWIILYGIMA